MMMMTMILNQRHTGRIVVGTLKIFLKISEHKPNPTPSHWSERASVRRPAKARRTGRSEWRTIDSKGQGQVKSSSPQRSAAKTLLAYKTAYRAATHAKNSSYCTCSRIRDKCYCRTMQPHIGIVRRSCDRKSQSAANQRLRRRHRSGENEYVR